MQFSLRTKEQSLSEMFLVVLYVSLLALKFPFTAPQNILEKSGTLDSGAEYGPNETASKQQGRLTPPPFLLKMYDNRKESALLKVHSLQSLQAERKQVSHTLQFPSPPKSFPTFAN